MQFKVTLSGLTDQFKSIPLTPGVYLLTAKIDVALNNSSNEESSSMSAFIGDDQTIMGATLSANASESKTASSFSFAQLVTVTDADCKVKLSGPGAESGATSASATFYVCAERQGVC